MTQYMTADEVRAHERRSPLERALENQLRGEGLTGWVSEYRFAAEATGGTGRGLRKRLARAGFKDWRFDFAFIEQKLAIEVDGGTYSRGRHVRPKGYEGDCAKLNVATVLGWRVLRFTASQVNDRTAIATIRKAGE
jgi:hypothetical protein